MSLEELRFEKEKLEEEMSEMINEFQEKIGCYVSDINLYFEEFRRMSGICRTKAKVVLEIKF